MILFLRLSTAIYFTFMAIAAGEVQAQPGGPGGIGGPGGEDIELVEKYDQNNDGLLNKSERSLARKEIVRLQTNEQGRRRGPGGPHLRCHWAASLQDC